VSAVLKTPPPPTVLEARQRILDLELELRSVPGVVGPEAFVTRHHFAPGSYAREIELPKGSRVVGKIHRHAHVNVISKGRVLVGTPDGVFELEAPLTFVSQPGTKRVVVALEDTVWTTVHVSNSTDLGELERELMAPTFDDFDKEQGL
jgi:quercetin dioxygenase-like cupin family protein